MNDTEFVIVGPSGNNVKLSSSLSSEEQKEEEDDDDDDGGKNGLCGYRTNE